LGPEHRVLEFKCERSERVQHFIRARAAEDVQKNICKVFVFPNPEDPGQIWGYYTLSAEVIARKIMSSRYRGKLGRDKAPMALLGYMGRSDGLEPGKYGAWLIQDAARRALLIREHIGIWGLMLDAEKPELMSWYEKRGFLRPPEERVDPERKTLMYAPLEKFLPELSAA
jgi:hypothetical protein